MKRDYIDKNLVLIKKGCDKLLILEGKYNSAKVFTKNIDENAKNQIIELLDQRFVEDAKIRIMPDVHAGKGSVIGFTANLGDKIIPNIVGVDIGCGILCVKLDNLKITRDLLKKLDDLIKYEKLIPSGFNIRKSPLYTEEELNLDKLYCKDKLKNLNRILNSVSTLGGGNHFIEIAKDSNNDKYLLIHSGSRNLGKQIADYYQKVAIKNTRAKYNRNHLEEQIEKLNQKEQTKEVKSKIKRYKRKINDKKIPRDLSYISDIESKKYLNDMKIAQEYASLNRYNMAKKIVKVLYKKDIIDELEYFETIHNYINFEDNIIRKGAISAKKDEKVIIPINMQYGSILAKGKGNSDWNNSAPHGAGRIMSRNQARRELSLEEMKDAMEGIFSTSVSSRTLDESPEAYRSAEEIKKHSKETIEIIDILKPIYNFKS